MNHQDTWLLFAWGLIALPKETFFDDIKYVKFQSLPSNIWGKWDIEIWDNENTLKNFVRHVRNSLNHGRFSETNLQYTFEDRLNDKSPINFRVHTDYESILRFAISLGDGYMMDKWPN